jgi:hypothetical protein
MTEYIATDWSQSMSEAAISPTNFSIKKLTTKYKAEKARSPTVIKIGDLGQIEGVPVQHRDTSLSSSDAPQTQIIFVSGPS